jgi:hypothetical protein
VRDPTAAATVGGIAQATNAWWRNQQTESAATTWELVRQEIQSLRLDCSDNAADDMPDLMMTDQIVYEYLLNYIAAKGQHAFVNNQMTNVLNFDVIRVMGMDVLWDENVPNMSATATKSSVFLMNTEFLRINMHEDRMMTMGEKLDMLPGKGQDAFGWPIFFMGALSCSNRQKQGLLHKVSQAITA